MQEDATGDKICLIVLGMAGSGKTTFIKKLYETLTNSGSAPFVVNLDPACLRLPCPCNIGALENHVFFLNT